MKRDLVPYNNKKAIERSRVPVIVLLSSGFLTAIMGITSFALFHFQLRDFGVITTVLAILSATLGPAFSQIKKDLEDLKEVANAITPDFIQAYMRALSPTTVTDHSLPLIAETLYGNIEPAFVTLANSKPMNNQVFFARMMEEVGKMSDGNRLLAVCGRKFWTTDSQKLVDEYWTANKKKASERVLIQRVFVSDLDDETEFSKELQDTVEKHKKLREELRHCTDPSGQIVDHSERMQLRLVGREARDALNEASWIDAKFGFALISRGHEKIVSLHRLVDDNHLRGLVISDPLVYSIFEQQFWSVWNVGRPI